MDGSTSDEDFAKEQKMKMVGEKDERKKAWLEKKVVEKKTLQSTLTMDNTSKKYERVMMEKF